MSLERLPNPAELAAKMNKAITMSPENNYNNWVLLGPWQGHTMKPVYWYGSFPLTLDQDRFVRHPFTGGLDKSTIDNMILRSSLSPMADETEQRMRDQFLPHELQRKQATIEAYCRRNNEPLAIMEFGLNIEKDEVFVALFHHLLILPSVALVRLQHSVFSEKIQNN